MRAEAMKGTLLIAPEGINGTVSGTSDATKTLLDTLRADPRFSDLEVKQAYGRRIPSSDSKFGSSAPSSRSHLTAPIRRSA